MSYRNRSIGLQGKSIGWLLYGESMDSELVKSVGLI